jgi:hypothetical protein
MGSHMAGKEFGRLCREQLTDIICRSQLQTDRLKEEKIYI